MTAAILAIDLGTRAGWAVQDRTGSPLWGAWDLSPRYGEGGGMRLLRFRCHLRELLERAKPDFVVYELVHRHLGTNAAHVYGALRGVVQEECELRKIPYEGISPGEWKKSWGLKGNAGKPNVLMNARRLHGVVESEDEADALGILAWAKKHREGGAKLSA